MLKRAVQILLSTFGYKLVPADNYRPSWNLVHFFPLLKSFGFAPRHIWDVGANRGDWTRTAIRYFPDSEYTLLEPQDNLKKNLDDLIRRGYKIRWINAGAGPRSGVFPFYISARDEGSSFLDAPRITQEAARRVDVPMRTLNEVAATLSLPAPEMLKIDAEGLDLKVLEGATELLGRTEIVLVEVSIGQLDFENTAGAVVQAMDGYGYRLIDITDVNRSPAHGVLWLCEFAFLLKSSSLLNGAVRY
jgi:FkbM family methyltransferase